MEQHLVTLRIRLSRFMVVCLTIPTELTLLDFQGLLTQVKKVAPPHQEMSDLTSFRWTDDAKALVNQNATRKPREVYTLLLKHYPTITLSKVKSYLYYTRHRSKKR
jgi:hypothetical protein